jgi:hypothetical protein
MLASWRELAGTGDLVGSSRRWGLERRLKLSQELRRNRAKPGGLVYAWEVESEFKFKIPA